MVFGQVIVEHRRRLGLTQEALAEKTGLSARSLRELESGRVQAPRMISVQLLADAFALAGEERERFCCLAFETAEPAKAPAQLPADLVGFIGREGEIAYLDRLLADAASRLVVAAVHGTAGVGKTSLAVHWAHRVQDCFPDGRLYVNLRGFGPSGAAAHPAEVLRDFLAVLGIPAVRIPGDLQARAALYRTVLNGRRVLVLMDNARDADQVRPLLPGSAGCLTVVTSRTQLTSLVAIEGARPVGLERLTAQESRAMLVARLGAARAAAEPEVLEQLSTACARLPIALAIVAARAGCQPELPLSALAQRLTGAEKLDSLDGGDPSSDLRTVFSWSYQTLSPACARLFRLLGLHPGPQVTVAAAASLAGAGEGEAARLLDELSHAHLLSEQSHGRFVAHDLLHAYAADLTARTDTSGQRLAAQQRLLDHYLHTAIWACRLIHPHQGRITLPPPLPDVTVSRLPDTGTALAWFRREDAVLVALIHLAGRIGLDAYVWRLARSRDPFAFRHGRWGDLIEIHRAALDAARRAADRSAEAEVRRSLARAHTLLGEHREARRQGRVALDLFAGLGDRIGQAQTEHTLTELFERLGEHEEALEHARKALALYEMSRDRPGIARALNAVGWCLARLDSHLLAVEHCRRALALFRSIGDQDGEAAACGSLGYAYQHLGRLTEAVDSYSTAARLCRELGERFYQADTLTRLGDTHLAAGDGAAARAAWQDALAIFTDLGHPDASEVQARLGQ